MPEAQGVRVNEQLQLLISLQKIDSTILAARRDVDLMPLRLSEREAALKKAEALYAQAEKTAEEHFRKSMTRNARSARRTTDRKTEETFLRDKEEHGISGPSCGAGADRSQHQNA